MPQVAHPTPKVISDWFAWQNRKRFHVVKSDREDQRCGWLFRCSAE